MPSSTLHAEQTPASAYLRDASEICIDVDRCEQGQWDVLLSEFADANPYQTWAYGLAHFGARRLSHLVLRDGSRVMAMAQVSVMRLPGLPVGGAYVSRGPVWQRKDAARDPSVFRAILDALRREYARRRGLFLQVVPNLHAEDAADLDDLPRECGYTRAEHRYRTLLLDLRPTVEELRAGLRPNWRKSLRRAEAAAIQVEEGSDLSFFDEALAVHREMQVRKGYTEFVDMEEFRGMQQLLPEALRMHLALCRYQGKVIAALGWSVYGRTGVPLIGATRPEALDVGAAYLLYWRMLEWMKQHGFDACDLAGINPERNPGSHVFKSGIARRHGRLVNSFGELSACDSAASAMAFRLARRCKDAVSRTRLMAERLRQSRKSVPSSTARPSDEPPPAEHDHG